MNPAPKNRPERLQQSEQLRRAVYDVPGAALLQLGTRAEPPRDARRTDAGEVLYVGDSGVDMQTAAGSGLSGTSGRCPRTTSKRMSGK